MDLGCFDSGEKGRAGFGAFRHVDPECLNLQEGSSRESCCAPLESCPVLLLVRDRLSNLVGKARYACRNPQLGT